MPGSWERLGIPIDPATWSKVMTVAERDEQGRPSRIDVEYKALWSLTFDYDSGLVNDNGVIRRIE